MKKFIKLFTPILGVSTVAAVAAPMSSCSSTCTITLTTDGNGELSQTTLSVAKGTSFAKAIKKLKITPNDGYSFNGWVDEDGKKFNTHKGITSNFTAKAVFEEGSVLTGEPLYLNTNFNVYSLNPEATEWEDLKMKLVSDKEYIFGFQLVEGHIPYRFMPSPDEGWQTNVMTRDFIVMLNNTDITSDCKTDSGYPIGYIEFPSELRSTFKTGDILTIKFKVIKSSYWEYVELAPVVYMTDY